MTSSRPWQPKALPPAIAMFEATMEALIGLVARQRGLSTTCLAMRWLGKGGPALSCSACRAAIPAADRTGTDGTGGRVAGRRSPAPADDLHHGSVGLPLVIAGGRRWLAAQAAPFSAR